MDFDSMSYTNKLYHNTFVIFFSARGRGSLLLKCPLQVKLPSSKCDTKKGNAEILQAVFLSSCNMGKGPNKMYTQKLCLAYSSITAVTVHGLKNLLKVKVKIEVQKWRQYAISYLLSPPFPHNKVKHNFLNSWTFVVHQFPHRIANAVSSEQ